VNTHSKTGRISVDNVDILIHTYVCSFFHKKV
jgi:hypothetical protein